MRASRFALAVLCVATLGFAVATSASAPGMNQLKATDTRWPTATATEDPPIVRFIMPCSPDAGEKIDRDWLDVVHARLQHWGLWLSGRLNGTRWKTRMPLEIPLAIIAHESRGAPFARGAAGEVGLFQILPGDGPQGYTGRPSTKWLSLAVNNLWWGNYLLERVAWYGDAYVNGLDPTYFREVAEASDIEWWYGPEGRAAIAIYNCGPGAYPDGRCAPRGGDYYAAEVLTCWVPWVQRVVLGQIDEDERRYAWAWRTVIDPTWWVTHWNAER